MRGFTPAPGEPGEQTRCRELGPGELDTMDTRTPSNKSYVAAR